jgi:hypothetical protein
VAAGCDFSFFLEAAPIADGKCFRSSPSLACDDKYTNIGRRTSTIIYTYMLRSLTTRAIDMLMRPQISNFCFESALRMSRTDAKCGAALAITAVHQAIHLALQERDDSALNEMLVDGQIAPALHLALMSEVCRGRDEGTWATELMLTELTEQRQQVEGGEATLKATRLIAGAQRRLHSPESMIAMHRLHVGSHLVRMPLSIPRGPLASQLKPIMKSMYRRPSRLLRRLWSMRTPTASGASIGSASSCFAEGALCSLRLSSLA